MRLTNERVGVFLARRSVQHLVSVLVQDFVSGRAYYVNHYHTMYVISLSNISVKENFKQITRIEIR
jgi:hypothetical protein